MSLKTQLSSTRRAPNVPLLWEHRQLDNAEVKRMSRLLGQAYKNNEISGELFRMSIKILMVSLFENHIESKLENKCNRLEEKLYKHFM